MNELNPAQCYQFLLEHNGVRTINAGRFWAVVDLEHDGDTREAAISCTHPTPEAAITAYWHKYHKDWTPPEVHDAEWALEYAKKKRLRLIFLDVTHGKVKCEVGPSYRVDNFAKDENDNIIAAVEKYKAKHDPDKVEETREQRLEKLLRRLRNTMFETPCDLRREIDAILKEAAEGAAKSPDLRGDKGSEADHDN